MSKEKKKGSCFGTILKGLLVVVIIFAALIAYVDWSSKKDAEKREAEKLAEYTELAWPTSEVAKRVPQPKDMTKGKVSIDTADGFVVELAKVDKSAFKEYVESCKQAGFTEDYSASDGFYSAKDIDGYSLYMNLDDNDYLYISADAPKEETEATTEEVTSTPEPETTEESMPTPEGSSSDGIRADFKEAMDSYEEFMNEYVDFMTKYNNSSDASSMLSDYADYMSKYADMTKKFNEWESDDLSTEEMNYYIDVQSRVLKKLATVQ